MNISSKVRGIIEVGDEVHIDEHNAERYVKGLEDPVDKLINYRSSVFGKKADHRKAT